MNDVLQETITPSIQGLLSTYNNKECLFDTGEEYVEGVVKVTMDTPAKFSAIDTLCVMIIPTKDEYETKYYNVAKITLL